MRALARKSSALCSCQFFAAEYINYANTKLCTPLKGYVVLTCGVASNNFDSVFFVRRVINQLASASLTNLPSCSITYGFFKKP